MGSGRLLFARAEAGLNDFFGKPQTVPDLSKTIPVTSYTFRERKMEGGGKISSKEMGEKGKDFLPPFPFYMT